MRSQRSLKVSHTQTSVPCGTLNNLCLKDIGHSKCNLCLLDDAKRINFLESEVNENFYVSITSLACTNLSDDILFHYF